MTQTRQHDATRDEALRTIERDVRATEREKDQMRRQVLRGDSRMCFMLAAIARRNRA